MYGISLVFLVLSMTNHSYLTGCLSSFCSPFIRRLALHQYDPADLATQTRVAKENNLCDSCSKNVTTNKNSGNHTRETENAVAKGALVDAPCPSGEHNKNIDCDKNILGSPFAVMSDHVRSMPKFKNGAILDLDGKAFVSFTTRGDDFLDGDSDDDIL